MLFTKPHITENVNQVNEHNLRSLVKKYRDGDNLPLAKIYISWANFVKLHLEEIAGVQLLPGPGLHDKEVHLLT